MGDWVLRTRTDENQDFFRTFSALISNFRTFQGLKKLKNLKFQDFKDPRVPWNMHKYADDTQLYLHCQQRSCCHTNGDLLQWCQPLDGCQPAQAECREDWITVGWVEVQCWSSARQRSKSSGSVAVYKHVNSHLHSLAQKLSQQVIVFVFY